MQISLSWLKDYVDLGDLSPKVIAETLTDLGLAVDQMNQVSSLPAGLVVGKVLEAQRHPNADTLQVCKVDVGQAAPLSIVCGAPNARAGIHVAVATVGTELPGNFKIKEAKIRGEKSFGMLCSGQELGLSDDHEGILELSLDFKPGSSAAAALGAADTVFVLDLTPNRADCLSVIGVARDLAARLGKPLKKPQPKPATTAGLTTQSKVRLQIASADACPRFCALYFQNVPQGPSPDWMQRRLEAAGMRPVSAVVDVTNYVMLEYGQPVHAYDERDLAGGVLGVRFARNGETLVTLDGQTRTLTDSDIVIVDDKRPVGLAGVMGGQNSEIKPDTRHVVLEVAAFPPLAIRKTSRRLALRSEASLRFERGIDIGALPTVAARVAELLQNIVAERAAASAGSAGDTAPFAVAKDTLDHYPKAAERAVIALRLSRARELLALPSLTKERTAALLAGLGIPMIDSRDDQASKDSRMVFEIPTHRRDLEREVDLIEEVGRLAGFDKIPYELPVMSIRPTPEDPFVEFLEDVRTAAASAGLRETISFPFWSERDAETLQIPREHAYFPSMRLANPINAEEGHLQTTLVAGLLRAVARSARHGQQSVRLFECGRGYFEAAHLAKASQRFPLLGTESGPIAALALDRAPRHFSARAQGDAGRPVERHLLCGMLGQPHSGKTWESSTVLPAGFHHARAVLDHVARAFRVASLRLISLHGQNPAPWPFLAPAASAMIVADVRSSTAGASFRPTVIGWIGELHPRTVISAGLDVDSAPVAFEIDLEWLFAARDSEAKLQTTLQRFPPATRDLALLVDRTVTHARVSEVIAAFPKKRNLRRASLFDVYKGENVAAEKKSMAYSVEFQSIERTLTDQEVEGEMNDLVGWLRKELGAEQR